MEFTRLVLKDGAIGTTLAQMAPSVSFFESLNLDTPQIVAKLHEAYVKAGADILTTNSFSAHPLTLAEWGAEKESYAINQRAARLARKAAEKAKRKVWVAGSMGPTNQSVILNPSKERFEKLREGYALQGKALLDGGADFLLVETIHDPLSAKAALQGILSLKDQGYHPRFAFSLTVDASGKSLGGMSVPAFVVSFSPSAPLYLGLNCALGPKHLGSPLRELAEHCPLPVALVPNAGLPDEKGNYPLNPQSFFEALELYLKEKRVNVVGGCCGTTPDHIALLKRKLHAFSPRTHRGSIKGWVAGLIAHPLKQSPPPFVVGERANTLGSKTFRKLVEKEDLSGVQSFIKAQVSPGVHGLDLGFISDLTPEERLWDRFLPSFLAIQPLPVFIDTTRLEVVEKVLPLLPGKPIVNSINLEEGEERIKRLGSLRKTFPFAVVAGCIDEAGMAREREKKLKVAHRLVELLLKAGFQEDEILIDPLVFPFPAGEDPRPSIEALRLLKKAFPQSFTIMGVSNISFGVPQRVRKILNHVFLRWALQEGLDIALIDISLLKASVQISPEDGKLAEKALKSNNQSLLQKLVERYRERKMTKKTAKTLPLEEALKEGVISGVVPDLARWIQALLQKYTPLEIIQGPLGEGMKTVGALFQKGELIVSEVLLSAEVFQKAMDLLEPHMVKKKEGAAPKVLLATVKGDVHDIGKNLVGMILRSQGFQVVDLGTRCPAEVIWQKVLEEKPLAVGLSGLLVRSTFRMKETAELLAREGIGIPLVLGGAALTRRYVAEAIIPAYPTGSVYYAKDCIQGLSIFQSIREGKSLAPLTQEAHKKTYTRIRRKVKTPKKVEPPRIALPWEKSWNPLPLKDLLPLLDKKALLHKHFLAKKKDRPKAEAFLAQALAMIQREPYLIPMARVGIFPAHAWKNKVYLWVPGRKKPLAFPFVRSFHGECAADWVRKRKDAQDSVGLLLTTVHKNPELWECLKKEKKLKDLYVLEVLALELAEASAEWVHRKIRKVWGIPEGQGVRLSPGYPACPDLSLQRRIFQVLQGETLGVSITEDDMLIPESSVSAVVFHHPEGRYYRA